MNILLGFINRLFHDMLIILLDFTNPHSASINICSIYSSFSSKGYIYDFYCYLFFTLLIKFLNFLSSKQQYYFTILVHIRINWYEQITVPRPHLIFIEFEFLRSGCRLKGILKLLMCGLER